MAIGDIRARTVTRPGGTTYTLYQGEYRNRDGERKFISARTKKEAQKKLRDRIGGVESGTDAKDGNITLGEVIVEYIAAREEDAVSGDIDEDYMKAEKNRLRLYVSNKLKRMKLSQFEDSGIIKEELKVVRRDKGLSVSTMNNTKATLYRVFAFV